MPSDKSTINYICDRAENSVAFLNLEMCTDHTACITTKGILRYKFNITGKAAHSARCTEGANAVLEAAHKIIELEKMKDTDGLTCNCGVIEGGTVANTVAETCSFYADIRFSNNEQMTLAVDIVKKVAEQVFVPGCSCTVELLSERPAMVRTQRNIDLLNHANKIFADNNLPTLSPRNAMGGSDAAYVTERGIPCIEGLGPSGGGVHAADEWMDINSLKESAKRITSIVCCL